MNAVEATQNGQLPNIPYTHKHSITRTHLLEVREILLDSLCLGFGTGLDGNFSGRSLSHWADYIA